ncbi:MAG TPA: TIGR03000 domain-containing protein [Gemmataceae bacterium]|nr:TIGR03000 domain-containing protein [Gemmataceae bacterium]
MKRITRIDWRWASLLALVLLGEVIPPARGEEKKTIRLDVLLPEDAELEVNGHKTKSTGKSRHFESPPVPVGRTYVYSLKASWQGNTLTRRIQVRPERLLTLDLRKELEEMAAPKLAGSFVLLAPPSLMVRVEQKVAFPLRVKRFDFADSIRIRFEKLPQGITAPDVQLSEGQTESQAVLYAAASAPQGSHEIHIAAASGATKDSSTIQVLVIKPEKKPTVLSETKVEKNSEPKLEITAEHKPEAKPLTKQEKKTSPGLRLLSPVQIALHPGQSKYVEIKAATVSGTPLPAEPVVTLVGPPASKLTSAVWTIFDFKNNPSAHTVGFAVKAAPDAPPGEQKVTVQAASDKARIEQVLRFQIHPVETQPHLGALPPPVLQLVLPASVEVSAGKNKYIEVQVKTSDGSPFAEQPRAKLETSPRSRLRSSPWTFSYKAGQSACTIGLSVTAETASDVGQHEARLFIFVGNERAERTLKVIVKPLSESPAKP